MNSSPLLGADESALLALVPADGSTIGNTRARDTLGWEAEKYWRARDVLEDSGLIVRGVGRGGTIRRIGETAVTETVTVEVEVEAESGGVGATAEASFRREAELYEPMAEVLRTAWTKDHRTNPLSVEITAHGGSRQTGGTWSRPDIVSIEVRTYEYVPGKFLEVDTFEVKPSSSINVLAVYEALSHRRASSRAYVLLHVPKEEEAALDEAVRNVRLVARSHGIGVVVASDPADYGTWEEVEEAQRVEPDPERLNGFIETQLSDRLKRKLARTLR